MRRQGNMCRLTLAVKMKLILNLFRVLGLHGHVASPPPSFPEKIIYLLNPFSMQPDLKMAIDFPLHDLQEKDTF